MSVQPCPVELGGRDVEKAWSRCAGARHSPRCSALGLAACGSCSGGKEGGTLTGTYASFPDYLDPALSYTVEGWTAMYDTYLPLLTYAHANGAAGSKVVPGLAESLPKISNGGKTYTLTLRKGLKYSDGTPVKASDFASAIERLFKLNSPGSPFYERHRRRRKVRRRPRAAASPGSRPTTRPARSSST